MMLVTKIVCHGYLKPSQMIEHCHTVSCLILTFIYNTRYKNVCPTLFYMRNFCAKIRDEAWYEEIISNLGHFYALNFS